jgi:hypothetical protein
MAIGFSLRTASLSPTSTGNGTTPDEHLATCLADRWRNYSLGFVPTYCGYSDYSNVGLVGLANFNFMTDGSIEDPHDAIQTVSYGWNEQGIVVDLRFVSAEAVETIQALEHYPLISEEEHSRLEYSAVEKDWGEASISDRVRILQDLGECIFSARNDSLPWENDRLREYIVSSYNEYPTSLAA